MLNNKIFAAQSVLQFFSFSLTLSDSWKLAEQSPCHFLGKVLITWNVLA